MNNLKLIIKKLGIDSLKISNLKLKIEADTFMTNLKNKKYQIVLAISLAFGRRFSGCVKGQQKNNNQYNQEEQITNCKGSKNKIHDLSPFPASIYATSKPVKEISAPSINSIKEGLETEGRMLGKKYPTTLYNPTPLDKSSAYFERSLYCEVEGLLLNKESIFLI